MTKRILTLVAAVMFVATAFAQELSLSGSIDTYIRGNSAAISTTGTDTTKAPSSSFANGSGFGLGMANIIASMEGEKSGFVADLVFGPRGNDAVFNSTTGSTPIVNQLYAYWNVSDAVTLTIGNWNTFLGYEVISPASNFNYSTSYMFSYGPFSHSGLKADIGLTDELSLMLALMNPTDWTDYNPTHDSYTAGLQLGYSTDAGGAWLNFVYGDQDGVGGDGELLQVDLTTGWDLTDALYLGLNATIQTTSTNTDDVDSTDVDESSYGFLGGALYLQYALSEDLSLGVRGEYFSENGEGGIAIDNYDKAGDASVIDLTLSANYKIGNLTLIPEIRMDSFSDAETGGQTVKVSGITSYLLAAVYSF